MTEAMAIGHGLSRMERGAVGKADRHRARSRLVSALGFACLCLGLSVGVTGCGSPPRHRYVRPSGYQHPKPTGPYVLPGGFVSVCTGGTKPPCH